MTAQTTLARSRYVFDTALRFWTSEPALRDLPVRMLGRHLREAGYYPLLYVASEHASEQIRRLLGIDPDVPDLDPERLKLEWSSRVTKAHEDAVEVVAHVVSRFLPLTGLTTTRHWADRYARDTVHGTRIVCCLIELCAGLRDGRATVTYVPAEGSDQL